MAIAFTSPKKRQRIIFRVITVLLILFLLIISLTVFPPEFKNGSNIPVKEVFQTPDVTINFAVLDSDQMKSLDPFFGVETEFTYSAKDTNGKQIIGKILAPNKDAARALLEKKGFKAPSLQEASVGRSEPFLPYYQSAQSAAKTSFTK